ncbi:MAG: L-ribulose-5-phosphate 4-epimerase AraD [Clostridia bacterium]|nr:L-ribulose-5-phosphate 4-epimerase AraD [Clostridia bacterium]
MRALQEKVYEANMLLWRRGLVIFTWGNVSEADTGQGIMGIKPSGVPYETMRVEDIVVLEIETGRKIFGALRPSSDTPTHLVLYRAYPHIRGITHTHSRYATAWAQAGEAIPCFGTTHADHFFGDVRCTRGLTVEEVSGEYEAETGRVIAESFGGGDPLHCPAIIVRNHGPFAFGRSAMESAENAVVLEEVAAMAALTRGIDPDAGSAPPYLQRKHFDRKHGIDAYYGQTSGEPSHL